MLAEITPVQLAYGTAAYFAALLIVLAAVAVCLRGQSRVIALAVVVLIGFVLPFLFFYVPMPW